MRSKTCSLDGTVEKCIYHFCYKILQELSVPSSYADRYLYIYIYIYTHTHIYRVSQEKCAKLRESVPYVKVYRYNPKHQYPKLNGYGDNSQRKVGASCSSKYCNPHSWPSSSCHWDWFQEWTVCMGIPKCAVTKVLSVLPYSWLYIRHVTCLYVCMYAAYGIYHASALTDC
jgi:hypothetical protein